MEEQHCEDAKSLPEVQVEMVSDFLARWHISRMTEQDRQVTRPDIVIDVDHIAQTSHAHVVQPAPARSLQRLRLYLTRGRVRQRRYSLSRYSEPAR